MFQRLYKKLLVAIITIAVITINLSARWEEYNKRGLEMMEYKHNVKVNADGSSEEIVKQRIKVLNKSGVIFLNNLLITYDKKLMDIDVLDAYTITDGTKYVVTGDLILTQAVSSPDMHSQDKHQIFIPFPQLEVGSVVQLSLKYKNRALFPNHYYSVVQAENLPCATYALKNAYCKITSEIPLYIKVNDPHNVLSIKTDAKSEQDSFNIAEMTLNKPLIPSIADGCRFNAVMSDEYRTWISVSSFNKWEDYHEGYDYFMVLKQKLPRMLADIANKAKNYTNEEAQIGFVMSAITDNLKCKNDLHAIRRLTVPRRDLQDIVSTRVGDSRELSVSTGAILHRLGYKAYPGLVYKGNIYDGMYKEKPYLPSPYNFDHAIIKVIGNKGKIYWLDPTHVVVSVNRPPPNIAGKMALVFTANQTASYEYIPQVDYDHAKVIEELVLVKYDNGNNIASFQGKDTYKGEKSLRIMNSLLHELRHSPNQADNDLFGFVRSHGLLTKKHKKHIALLTKIKSRLLQDIGIEYEYDLHGTDNPPLIYHSNLGKVSVMPRFDEVVNPILSAELDQVSDIQLCSFPYTLIRKLVVKGQKIKNASNLNWKINTKWIDIERVCRHVDEDIEITTTIKCYKHIIRSADLKTQEYKILQEQVKDMLLNAAIVLE